MLIFGRLRRFSTPLSLLRLSLLWILRSLVYTVTVEFPTCSGFPQENCCSCTTNDAISSSLDLQLVRIRTTVARKAAMLKHMLLLICAISVNGIKRSALRYHLSRASTVQSFETAVGRMVPLQTPRELGLALRAAGRCCAPAQRSLELLQSTPSATFWRITRRFTTWRV